MGKYREPPFREPLSSTFVYAAWSIDPVRIGPFVRSSRARRQGIEVIGGIARTLAQRPDVEGIRLFETSFIPPLPGVPNYDVVMLVCARTTQCANGIVNDPLLRSVDSATVFTASNAARFGDTESPPSGVNILLNHFVGPSDRSAAVSAWREISAWFAAKLQVDNSTLLYPEDGAPYVLVNYVRLPSAVVPFLLGQLLRPSFHRFVRSLLTRHGLTSLPLFVRPVTMGPTDE
jgi:hypothetical protein